MATTAHCAFCFETLSASIEERKAMQYERVLELWDWYHSLEKKLGLPTEQEEDNQLGYDMPGGLHSAEASEKQKANCQAKSDRSPLKSTDTRSGLQLPSISRIQASSPASPVSSGSTPSSHSAASSTAALADSDSKSSSNSSMISPEPSINSSSRENAEYPLFVTWNTVSSQTGNKSLRGCIGTFDALELRRGLKSYALTAAFDDTRFQPISASELAHLSVSVTLLTAFTPCADPLDWNLGTHGIRISFTDRGRRFGATYLPDVAVEQGWNKEETLDSLMRKAGWSGKRRGGWKDVKPTVTRYEGKKQSLGYEEFQGWREGIAGEEESRRRAG